MGRWVGRTLTSNVYAGIDTHGYHTHLNALFENHIFRDGQNGISATSTAQGLYRDNAFTLVDTPATGPVVPISVGGDDVKLVDNTFSPEHTYGEPVSLFDNLAPVNTGTDGDYELGLKFQVTHPGIITAVRFYKPEGESGTHTGRIWAADGSLLAAIDFTGETGSGWQQADLTNPLSISPFTTIIASVNANDIYPIETNGLDNTITNGNLQSIADGNNGVFNVDPGQFPVESWNNSNYFRDVVFRPESDTPTQFLPPANLTATPYSGNHIALSWIDNNSGDQQEDAFIIERMPYMRNDEWHVIGQVGPDTTAYTDTDRIYGYVTYTYRVGAVKNE